MTMDTKRVPHPGYRFWLFDPAGDGMTYYRTAEDRDKAAAVAIDTCRGDGDEGWDEDGLEGIAAGEVTHVARVTDKKMRPDDLDDEQCDGEGTYWGDFEWMGNYTMVPLPNAGIERVEARKTYDRSMCPHEHAVNDWRLHPLTPNAQVQAPAVGGSPGTNS